MPRSKNTRSLRLKTEATEGPSTTSAETQPWTFRWDSSPGCIVNSQTGVRSRVQRLDQPIDQMWVSPNRTRWASNVSRELKRDWTLTIDPDQTPTSASSKGVEYEAALRVIIAITSIADAQTLNFEAESLMLLAEMASRGYPFGNWP